MPCPQALLASGKTTPWASQDIVSKGDEFNKAAPAPQALRLHQQLLRQQQGRMVCSPPTSLPRLLPVRVLKLAPARALCHERRLLSQAAAADEK